MNRSEFKSRATIIIPLRGQVEEWLEHCVRSALRQTTPTLVIVVVSTTTPASNLSLLDKLRRQHKNLEITCERKSGSFPNAINTGIQCATTDRVGLLLSDDWLDQRVVEICLRIDADIVSTGHAVYFPNGRLNELASRNASLQAFEALQSLMSKAEYLEHFFLFRREMLLRVGELDESIGNYPGIDDFDLIWMLLEHGATVGIVEEQLYHYRDHTGERLTLADPVARARNLEKILRKHRVSEQEIPEIVRRHARWFGRPIYEVMNLSDQALAP